MTTLNPEAKLDELDEQRGTIIMQVISLDRQLELDPANTELLDAKFEAERAVDQIDAMIGDIKLQAELDAQPEGEGNDEADLYDPADRF